MAALAACGGDAGEAATTASSTATSAVATTTSTTVDPAAEVEQAYRDFEAMLVRLREDPNPDDPEIDLRTTGQTRDGVVASQTTMKTLGERAAFGPQNSGTVLGVVFGDETAVVTTCIVEDITITNAAGTQFGPTVTTYWTDFTFTWSGDRWQVSYSKAIKKLDGEQPCEK